MGMSPGIQEIAAPLELTIGVELLVVLRFQSFSTKRKSINCVT